MGRPWNNVLAKKWWARGCHVRQKEPAEKRCRALVYGIRENDSTTVRQMHAPSPPPTTISPLSPPPTTTPAPPHRHHTRVCAPLSERGTVSEAGPRAPRARGPPAGPTAQSPHRQNPHSPQTPPLPTYLWGSRETRHTYGPQSSPHQSDPDPDTRHQTAQRRAGPGGRARGGG